MKGMIAALMNKGNVMEPETEDMDDEEPQVDPRASSADGGTLFIDSSMFPEGCKVGDRVKILATVTKHGQKYGVQPEEIVAEKDDGYGEEGGEA